MTKKEIAEKRALIQAERDLKMDAHNDNRAQSITIGSSGGGTTEISMRGVYGQHLWNVYQPVEVIEIINQMAANIGCHIHIQPREDFASWRVWKEPTDEEKKHLAGHAPFSSFLEDRRINGNNGLTRENIEMLDKKEKQNVDTKENINQ